MPVRNGRSARRIGPSEGLQIAPYSAGAAMRARQCHKIGELKAVLIAYGFSTVNKQAAVLGLSRSSAWKVLQSDYKQSGLSATTINRMLASPGLPIDARIVIEDYVRERLRGAYGHPAKRLKYFRSRLRWQTERARTGFSNGEGLIDHATLDLQTSRVNRSA
jgi:hypothetical protein